MYQDGTLDPWTAEDSRSHLVHSDKGRFNLLYIDGGVSFYRVSGEQCPPVCLTPQV